MHVSTLHNVAERDRKVAWAVASTFMLAVLAAAVHETAGIFRTRHTPPVVTTFLDAVETESGWPWGRMPYLLVRAQKKDGSVTCPTMSDVYYYDKGLVGHTEPSFRNLSNLSSPHCRNLSNKFVLINFTMLAPIFRTSSCGWRLPHKPTIDIRFAVAGSDGVDMFFAHPDAPADGLTSPWSGHWEYIGGVGDISAGSGPYVFTSVSKVVVPEKDTFWGFDPFDHHTRRKFEFAYYGYNMKNLPMDTDSKAEGVNFGWRITVPSPVVMERRPISVVSQMTALLSKVGGWLSVYTALFFALFARKYPMSVDEKINSRLTLCWKQRHTRNVEMGSFADQ